jgi:hypothetical protein
MAHAMTLLHAQMAPLLMILIKLANPATLLARLALTALFVKPAFKAIIYQIAHA